MRILVYFPLKENARTVAIVLAFFGENALFRKSATTFDRPELWTLKRIDGHNVGGAAVKAGEVTEAKLANPFVGIIAARQCADPTEARTNPLATQPAGGIGKAQIPQWPMKELAHVAQIPRSANFWRFEELTDTS